MLIFYSLSTSMTFHGVYSSVLDRSMLTPQYPFRAV